MSLNRATLYQALLAYWQALTVGASPAFKTCTDVAHVWADVAAEDQPALLQVVTKEDAQYRKGLPTIWRLRVTLYLYCHTSAALDPTISPTRMMDPLLDAIEDALTIDDISNEACTLGGLVSHCAIEGTLERYQGDMGDQATAIIPLTILISP